MRYSEISILGIYLAPFAVVMLGAWLITLPLRSFGDRMGIERQVWYPALFDIAVYVIMLSLVVLFVGGVSDAGKGEIAQCDGRRSGG